MPQQCWAGIASARCARRGGGGNEISTVRAVAIFGAMQHALPAGPAYWTAAGPAWRPVAAFGAIVRSGTSSVDQSPSDGGTALQAEP
jgi:hypothetical protein